MDYEGIEFYDDYFFRDETIDKKFGSQEFEWVQNLLNQHALELVVKEYEQKDGNLDDSSN